MLPGREVSVNPVGLLIVAAGAFLVGTGVFDWEFAMNSRQARRLSNMVTRKGARAVYVVLGVGVIVFGALMTAGVIAA